MLPGGIPIQTFMDARNYEKSPHTMLAEAGTSKVYKLNFGANDSESFVLKVIKTERMPLELLHREITILRQLKGKWFSVQLLAAAIVPDGVSYILYPYVKGKTLLDALKEAGFINEFYNPTDKIPNDDERKTFTDIYNALIDATYELHQMGIIHHDIKHDNIWITDDKPFFLDYGFSAYVGEPTGAQGQYYFRRENRYKTYNDKPPATANIDWYALGTTFRNLNPNSTGNPLHKNLQRPNLTNNVAKAIRYKGGRKTRGKQQRKQRKQRLTRRA